MKTAPGKILWISIIVFLLSLTQPCYCTVSSCGDSFAVLLSGTFGFLYGGAAVTWLANPLLLFSWIFVNKRPSLSLYTGLAALLLALSFLLFKHIINDEAGNYSAITGYGRGYWLWLISIALMAGGNVFRCLKGPAGSGSFIPPHR